VLPRLVIPQIQPHFRPTVLIGKSGRLSSYGRAILAAAADGSATVTWTPTDSGCYSLFVRSLTASGVRSMDTYYSFYIAPDC
jgi:hypothetical protein